MRGGAKWSTVVGLMLFGCLMASGAAAQEGLRLDAFGWAKLSIGSPGTAVRYGGGVEARGPFALGKNRDAWGEIDITMELEALPDKGALSFEDLSSWGNYAEVSGSFLKTVGALDVGDQKIRTSVLVRGSFATHVGRGADEEALRRYARTYGGGIQLEELTSRARVWIVYGQDDAVGPRGWGHWMFGGSVPIRRGPVVFFAKAGLGWGTPSTSGLQADYVTAGLGTATFAW